MPRSIRVAANSNNLTPLQHLCNPEVDPRIQPQFPRSFTTGRLSARLFPVIAIITRALNSISLSAAWLHSPLRAIISPLG